MSAALRLAMGISADNGPALPSESAWADPEDFKEVFRGHPAGVAVVTFRASGGPAGFTATSVVSVSAEPPIAVFSAALGASAHTLLHRTGRIVVNFLAEDQAPLARKFATRGIDRFAGTTWSALSAGEPVLAGAVGWVSGPIIHRITIGAGLVVAVQVDRAVRTGDSRPLLYHDRSFRKLGSSVDD